MTPSIAVVHDYLTQRGGAERVAICIAEAFPGAPLYTSVFDPERCFPELAGIDVRPSAGLNSIGLIRRHHRAGLPLYPYVFSRLDIDADVVICSSSGFAHGVRTSGRKIVYCHNPPRWLYQGEDYFSTSLQRAAFRPASRMLRRADRRAAASADLYLANSSAVRERIWAAYGIDATVVPPPPAVSRSGPLRPVDGLEPGFLLCVARLLPYKHVDAVVHAANAVGCRLVVVGRGPEARAIRRTMRAGSVLLSDVADDSLRWIYANAAGLISASHEDYGLTPLEAAAFGTPSAVLRAGGFLDTVVEDETGVFFDRPEPALIADAVKRLLAASWSPTVLEAQAERFSRARFNARLIELVTGTAPSATAGAPPPKTG
jgi:glycosyltransferase involved in cell wall biosynthesis